MKFDFSWLQQQQPKNQHKRAEMERMVAALAMANKMHAGSAGGPPGYYDLPGAQLNSNGTLMGYGRNGPQQFNDPMLPPAPGSTGPNPPDYQNSIPGQPSVQINPGAGSDIGMGYLTGYDSNPGNGITPQPRPNDPVASVFANPWARVAGGVIGAAVPAIGAGLTAARLIDSGVHIATGTLGQYGPKYAGSTKEYNNLTKKLGTYGEDWGYDADGNIVTYGSGDSGLPAFDPNTLPAPTPNPGVPLYNQDGSVAFDPNNPRGLSPAAPGTGGRGFNPSGGVNFVDTPLLAGLLGNAPGSPGNTFGSGANNSGGAPGPKGLFGGGGFGPGELAGAQDAWLNSHFEK